MKILKYTTLILLFAIQATGVFSQENPRIKKKAFQKSEAKFEEAWTSIKLADKKYTAGRGTYHLALEKYWTAYEYNDANAALNYKLGICYLYSGKSKVKALEHLQKAYEINSYVTEDINFQLGRAYHLNLDYENAVKEYNKFKSAYTTKQLERMGVDIDKYIQECENGATLMMLPVRVIIKNLGKNINTTFDEYNPIFHPDGKSVYFTARKDNTVKNKIVKKDNKYYEDIYKTEHIEDDWKPATHLEKPINTKANDHIIAFADNANTMYVYNGLEDGGEIMLHKMEKGQWGKSKKVPSVIRGKKSKETTMFLTSDGSTFYFVSNRKEDNRGGKDIFYCTKDERGKWMDPINLSDTINTKYDEEAIFFNAKEDTLFFSSRGHNSMGGFDVFKTWKNKTGEWVPPVNLGYPVNTPEDDLFYKSGEKPKTAYLSTIRDDGMGGFDIYKLVYLGENKELKMNSEDDTLLWNKKPDYKLFYRKPTRLEIDTTLYMMGVISDKTSSQGIVAKLQLIDKELSQIVGTTVSESNGNYKVKVDKKKDYAIEINATGYMFFIDTVELSKEQFMNDVAIRNFALDKVEVGAKMILRNIYFDTGKATLKPESYPELDRMVKFLLDNPTIRIEVSGHTDNVGSKELNKKLSKERAKSVVEYAIGHGISKGQLEYEGYGFDQPIAPNNTENGRSMNRRVEFKILSTK